MPTTQTHGITMNDVMHIEGPPLLMFAPSSLDSTMALLLH